VKNEIIISPKDHNILNGISRDYILNHLAINGYSKNMGILKDDISIYDVMNADEAFVSATPFCILPVISINGVEIGDGKRGSITQKLLDRWSNSVGLDIEKQIIQWNEKMETSDGVSPYQFIKKD
jgi:branched-chain amino acid aminotransferase